MQNTTEKSSRSAEGLYKFFIYFVLVLLAVTIIVPVAWVFMASIKQNAEFYGNPWALPAGFYWQNFVNAWNGAKMGEYMLNSVLVTALALVLLLVIALATGACLLLPQGGTDTAGVVSTEEVRLAQVLSSMAGAGKVEIAVRWVEEAATAVQQGSKTPVGAIVVAQGAEDVGVRLKLIRAVTTLLQLEPGAVEVFAMEQEGVQ